MQRLSSRTPRALSRTLAILLAALALTAAAGCTNPGGKVPVSSPVYAFQAPDAEDFAPDTDDDDSSDTDTDADGADSADGGE
jgi:hypothetical protein